MTQKMTRRAMVQSLCGGLGSIGLLGMLANEARAATAGHYAGPRGAGKAKHVVFLFMSGGPSQIDLFDPKPLLAKYEGQRPDAVDLRTERKTGGLLPSPFSFKKQGKSGVEVSELLPQLGSVIDEICVIRSMYSFNPTHAPAQSLAHSGSILANRPTLGAWCSYGLGTENDNLPAFVVLTPGQGGGSSLWRSGFLPAEYQGTTFDYSAAEPEKMIRYLRNTQVDSKGQRFDLDAVQALNREHLKITGEDEFLESRIKAMEKAFQMQTEAMDAFDLRKESAAIRTEYGATGFADGCLLARRMVERGVRYIHVYFPGGSGGGPWDDHRTINKNLRERCPEMDQAAATLIRDLAGC